MTSDLVLDIDFDYCVAPTRSHGYTSPSFRPSEGSVWLPATRLVDWLHGRGLLRRETFAGAVESHEQVLPIWVRLVASGALRVPFAVLHVDAHPDLMEVESALARQLDELERLDDTVVTRARPGDFLQFVVRVGWVDRIWMVFPDHEAARIDAVAEASLVEASAIVRKPVVELARGPCGGVETLVRIGRRSLPVGLHTRSSLPEVPGPTVTVLAHSPEFVPTATDQEFRALARELGAAA